MTNKITEISSEFSGQYTTSTLAPCRTESLIPSSYRLAKRPCGELVLQGAYTWSEGFMNSGYEWRDIPTEELLK